MRFSDKRSFILEQPESFLPNFCSNGVVFLVILIAELLAFVLTFAATESLQEFWLQLGPISLFIQWVALGAVAALCCFRVWIVTLSTPAATAAAYGLIQLVTLTFSLLTLQAADMIGLKFATDDWWQPHFVLRNLAISSIVSLVAFRYFYIQHQWKQNLEAEARARFQALQARIRPHFLFNSMNTIASLTRSQPEQAEEAILDLADLFRYTLEQPEKIRLQEELETTRRYSTHRNITFGRKTACGLAYRRQSASGHTGTSSHPAALTGKRRISRHSTSCRWRPHHHT